MGPIGKDTARHSAQTRLPLEVPVLVTSLDAASPFSEPCNTTLVNAHGCGLIVPRAIRQGIQVRLEIVSAKRHTTALVAEVVPLGGDPETWLVGLELEVPGNFWESSMRPRIGRSRRPRCLPRNSTQDQALGAAKRRWRLTDIQRGRLLPGDGCAISRRHSRAAEYPALDTECLLDGVVRVSHAQTGMGVEFTGTPAATIGGRGGGN